MDVDGTAKTAAAQLLAAFGLVGAATLNFAGAFAGAIAGTAVSAATAVTSVVQGTPAPPPIADDWVDLEPSTLVREVLASGDMVQTSNNPVDQSDPT